MDITTMSRDEKSLLLYFETCAVDLGGRVNTEKMNDEDMAITKRWTASRYIRFGRIIMKDHNSQGGNWVLLSDAALEDAHQLRLERMRRMEKNRQYTRTEEKNNGRMAVEESA